jgi:hypothetical protein
MTRAAMSDDVVLLWAAGDVEMAGTVVPVIRLKMKLIVYM